MPFVTLRRRGISTRAGPECSRMGVVQELSDPESWALAGCPGYVERNPLRANLVERAEQLRLSSPSASPRTGPVGAGTRDGKRAVGVGRVAGGPAEQLGRQGQSAGNASGTRKPYAGRRGVERLFGKPLGSSRRHVPCGSSGRCARRADHRPFARHRRCVQPDRIASPLGFLAAL
jgi:hypothetical protein